MDRYGSPGIALQLYDKGIETNMRVRSRRHPSRPGHRYHVCHLHGRSLTPIDKDRPRNKNPKSFLGPFRHEETHRNRSDRKVSLETTGCHPFKSREPVAILCFPGLD
jgi:hypothetical protein